MNRNAAYMVNLRKLECIAGWRDLGQLQRNVVLALIYGLDDLEIQQLDLPGMINVAGTLNAVECTKTLSALLKRRSAREARG